MTEKELVEAAAQVAGYKGEWVYTHPSGRLEGWYFVLANHTIFDPINDLGHALQLAIDVGICIDFTYCDDGAPIVGCGWDFDRENWVYSPNFPNPYKATCASIVNAVAKIDKEINND